MKCFEISFEHIFLFLNIVLTVNMKCFEIVGDEATGHYIQY